MALKDQAEMIAAHYKKIAPMLRANCDLMEIQEGDLLKFVEQEMSKQLSVSAFEVCKHRIPPINVQKRVVDKLSQIYAKPPMRKLGEQASETDKEMWEWYIQQFDLDISGQTMNEYFNLMKSCAWEPHLDSKMMPRLREIPKDRFFVIGTDPTDPMKVTHFIKVMGKEIRQVAGAKDGTMGEYVLLFAYTDDEFIALYDNGEVARDIMAQLPAPSSEGINIFGKIPFIYLNRSKVHINAPQDSDMFRMATLIPILFADVNYALMFQAFSIWYGINVDAETIPINPNSYISLKATQDNPGVRPEIGVIKPEVDSDKVITSIMEQLSLWLQSRGIRPGTVGRANGDNMVSGISKMVDEMDTSGDRQKQIPYFVCAEEELYELVTETMHPLWISNPSFKQKAMFSQELEYQVKFQEQISWQTRKEILDEVKQEMGMGLMSEETAMAKLYPDMSPEERTAELALAREDAKTKAALAPSPFGK